MAPYFHEQFDSALWVLSDMLSTFSQWYPHHHDFLPEEEQEHFSPQELQEAQNQFARVKLNLELGEYTSADYDYLKWIEDRVLDNEQYFEVVNTLIYILSEEYGPV